MYYIAKLAQAAGMTVIVIDFIRHFPDLMSRRILGVGIAFFAFGWVIEHFLLKR